MGRPSSGFFTPRASSASAARAAASPRSKSRTQIALILASCRSIRLIASSASSTAETFPAARAADNSTAVLKLHCTLAKAYSRSGCSMLAADDAQFAAAPQEQWLYSGRTVTLLRSWRQHRLRASLPINKNENSTGGSDEIGVDCRRGGSRHNRQRGNGGGCRRNQVGRTVLDGL